MHLKLLNHMAKTIISGIGAHKTKEAVVRCSKAVGNIDEILQQYDIPLSGKYLSLKNFRDCPNP